MTINIKNHVNQIHYCFYGFLQDKLLNNLNALELKNCKRYNLYL
ncbi:hypothetical protein BD749_2623 [Pontibacter ramchanderi]|uniref:Uncharacterized protein n=1 Tax=Pontibacter ramchanderi TaxID=1179743 RepID=A0A2N3U7R8_9BACT|nr:hypothetical protein BD749_2623 [Pontibacter ramchanderi]